MRWALDLCQSGHYYDEGTKHCPICSRMRVRARAKRRCPAVRVGTPSPGVSPERLLQVKAMYDTGQLGAYCDAVLSSLVLYLAVPIVLDELAG